MTWPGAWIFRATEMQMHRCLRRLLVYQEFEVYSIDGKNLTIVEFYLRALLITVIPTDDRPDVAVQVDLVI
jgi:hypothetical protein